MPDSRATLMAGSAVCSAEDGSYPVFERAGGVYYYDSTGKRYIDGSGGTSAVTSIGHGVAEIPAAMAVQADMVSCTPGHASVNRPAMELADLLSDLAPGTMRGHCKTWFCVTGSDATDDAVRLARQYWVEKDRSSKYRIITRWQSYHGMNIGCAGYSGNTARRSIFTPMFVDSPHIAPAYCYRCSFEQTFPSCKLLCARQLEATIRQVGAENIAAFIAEPVGGSSLAAVPAPEGYFQVIRDICSRYDVLFIADEVMTGLGRTGKVWGIEHWDVTPDILCTAKGITGGYSPLAAVIAADPVWQPLLDNGSPFRSGHTMSGNPVSCAAGVATIRYVLDHGVVENARVVGGYLVERLKELLRYPMVGDARGLGMMTGFEMVADRETKRPFPPESRISQIISEGAMRRGLLLYPLTGCVDGVEGHMVQVTPPLTMTRAQVDEMMGILHDTLTELSN